MAFQTSSLLQPLHTRGACLLTSLVPGPRRLSRTCEQVTPDMLPSLSCKAGFWESIWQQRGLVGGKYASESPEGELKLALPDQASDAE